VLRDFVDPDRNDHAAAREAVERLARLVEEVGQTRPADWNDGGRVWVAYNEVISGSDA
jgi:hypothetical protein